MSSATCPPTSGSTTTYIGVYPERSRRDAAGRRVAKEVGGAVTEADVYNTAGQVVSRYGPYPAETWLGDDVWVGGAHLAIYANGQTYFPLTDQVGTERVRFASTGGIVESCISLPFGDGLQCTGSDPDPYHFGKLERDAESGDDHAQHRDYNSIPGHWLSPDPAGAKVVSLTDPQTWNLYVYSDNNPVTDNDPSGLDSNYGHHDGPCYEHPCDFSTGIGCNNPDAGDEVAYASNVVATMDAHDRAEQQLSWSNLSPAQQALFPGGEKQWKSLPLDARANFDAITNVLQKENLLSEIGSASMRANGREMDVVWKAGAQKAFERAGYHVVGDPMHDGTSLHEAGNTVEGLHAVFPSSLGNESQVHIDYRGGLAHFGSSNDDVLDNEEEYKKWYGSLPGLIP